jgi:hypothetical protein
MLSEPTDSKFIEKQPKPSLLSSTKSRLPFLRRNELAEVPTSKMKESDITFGLFVR